MAWRSGATCPCRGSRLSWSFVQKRFDNQVIRMAMRTTFATVHAAVPRRDREAVVLDHQAICHRRRPNGSRRPVRGRDADCDAVSRQRLPAAARLLQSRLWRPTSTGKRNREQAAVIPSVIKATGSNSR